MHLEQKGVTHHLKSHLEDGSGVEAAEAISTVGGRAPRLGQPARWCSAGELARTKRLDWRKELFTRKSKGSGNRWTVGANPEHHSSRQAERWAVYLGLLLPKTILLVLDVLSHSEAVYLGCALELVFLVCTYY